MSFSPRKTRVAILRGGPSHEYEQSLQTGKYIMDNLAEDYEALDILISKDGTWHNGGLETKPHRVLQSVDAVWNALHGAYGEDGNLQRLASDFGVPFTGSSSVASSVGMNKVLAKQIFVRAGIKTPYYVTATRSEDPKEVIERLHTSLPFPIVVKPANGGSSVGLSILQNSREAKQAIDKAFTYSDTLLAEEFVDGLEVMSGVIEGFRGMPHYALLPHSFTGQILSPQDSKYIQDIALQVHQSLGLKDFSQVDFILHPKRGIFVLEVNTLPKLHESAGFIKSLQSVGSNIKEFISHTLDRIVRK